MENIAAIDNIEEQRVREGGGMWYEEHKQALCKLQQFRDNVSESM